MACLQSPPDNFDGWGTPIVYLWVWMQRQPHSNVRQRKVCQGETKTLVEPSSHRVCFEAQKKYNLITSAS